MSYTVILYTLDGRRVEHRVTAASESAACAKAIREVRATHGTAYASAVLER